jgi:crotonobetainyl-CoA:carnitine CoA-transferase CaiB-like acyl-CoA transferase
MIQGLSGVMSMTGERSGPPAKVPVAAFDFGAALLTAVAILASYIVLQRTGEGQHVDVSLLDCSLSWLTLFAMEYFATGEVPGRIGSASHNFAPYQGFRTQDGYMTIVGTGGKDSWGGLCRVLGLEHLCHDPRFDTNGKRLGNLHDLSQLIEQVLVTRPTEYWVQRLEEAGLPCSPINTLDQVLNDRHVHERSMIVEIDHPRAGRVKTTGIPIRFSKTPGQLKTPPPLLGQHTDEILSSLGYGKREIDVFRKEGVI